MDVAADKNSDEGYEKALSASLARILDLLKFAEAKNAALLAFASAWIVGIVNLLSSGRTFPPGFALGCAAALPLFVIAASLSIVSLLPKREPAAFTKEPKEGTNLLFFGHIAKMTFDNFKVEVRNRHSPSKGSTVAAGHLDDLAGQIFVNSRIAERKYRLFNRGALTALLAILVLTVPAVPLLCRTIVASVGQP